MIVGVKMQRLTVLILVMSFMLALSAVNPERNYEVPFFENFDEAVPPELPENWHAENTSDTGVTWVTYPVFPYSPPNCVSVFGDGQPKNEWLFSPGIVMDYGTSYRISFFYRTSFTPLQMQLKWGTAQSSEEMIALLFSDLEINNTVYTEGSVIFTPQETGIYYFGWHVFDNGNQGNIYLDDISIVGLDPLPYISLTPPHFNFGTVSVNESASTSVMITNEGGSELTVESVVVAPPFEATLNAVLPPGFSEEMIIDFNPVSAGFYSDTLHIQIQGDFEGINTLPLSGSAYSLMTDFFEDFEASVELPPGWSAVIESTSSSANVSIYQAGEFYNHAYSGEHCARLYNATTNDILMLVTPQLANLSAGELSFWTKTPVFSEPLVIVTLDSVANFDNFHFVSTIISHSVYEHYTITFADVPADHSYIAFMHGTTANLRPIFIDDVEWQTDPPVINPPLNLSAVPGDNTVELSWQPPEGTEPLGYNVYRDNSIINFTIVEDTTYVDTGVINNTTYHYYVTAIHSSGESEPSNVIEVTPLEIIVEVYPPRNLTAEVSDLVNVQLHWEEPDFGSWIHWDSGINFDGVGTGNPRIFTAAIKFSPEDIYESDVVDKYLTRISFFPRFGECIYTLKVWTGQDNGAPNELIHSQIVEQINVNEWNTVSLSEDILIDGETELWFGYEVQTQGGFPVGCDAGPAVDGKGNMVYDIGEWSTLLEISPTLDYNWNIQGFVTPYPELQSAHLSGGRSEPVILGYTMDTGKSDILKTSGEPNIELNQTHFTPDGPPFLTGYRVYRDNNLIAETNSETTFYNDYDLEDGTYLYHVTSYFEDLESTESNPVKVLINTEYVLLFHDDFSSYPDFSLTFPPWVLFDFDQSDTVVPDFADFPNAGSPMAFMIFNPFQTDPPADFSPVQGTKMAASFSALNPPNNDWMITPNILLGQNSYLTFWAKSSSSIRETFRIAVSTTSINPNNFEVISDMPYLETAQEWTQFYFDLSDFDNQHIFIAIQNISDSAEALFIDEVEVWSIKILNNPFEPLSEKHQTNLLRNYPNPFNPSTKIRFELAADSHVLLEIFNVKGQRVKTLIDDQLKSGKHEVIWNSTASVGANTGSGVYFVRLKTQLYSSTRKIILLK